MSKNILVIDDNKFILDLMSYVLDNSGYTVEVMDKAAGALDYIESNQPKLVILDAGLPDADGRDLCRQIKESATAHNIPVIMCSGKSDIKDCLQQEGPPDAVLPKPFDMNQLVQAVQDRLISIA